MQSDQQINSNSNANSNSNESMVCNFKIPVKKDQLFDEPANFMQFWVKDKINVTNLTDDTIML